MTIPTVLYLLCICIAIVQRLRNKTADATFWLLAAIVALLLPLPI